MLRPVLLSTLLLLAAASKALSGEDAEAGRRIYQKCLACHALAPESRATGPSLYGVIGRRAGTLEDFRYSRAMQESGVVWDEAALDHYLASPQTAIRGNRMAFAGVHDAKQREDLITFLKMLR